MKIVGDKMTARELKNKVVKKAYFDKVAVVGKLEAVIEGGCDNYYLIHNDEQIPVNVSVLIGIR